MRLTLKGRLIVALLVLLLFGGGGVYLYSQFTGLTLEQMWQQLTTRATKEPEDVPGQTDAEIRSQLLEALFNQPELRKQNIAFAVSNGVISFSGEVEMPSHKAALEQIGQQIAGVKQIINNVVVKGPLSEPEPASPAAVDADQQLAERVEFALYQTDAFDLKQMTITAREGRVRLSGQVRNMAEKLLAEKLTREVKGVSDVVSELRIQPPG